MQVTNKEFELFKKEFIRFQKLLGLTEWQIYFFHNKIESAYATVHIQYEDKVATVTLTTIIDSDDKPNFDAKRTARHECLHLLTAPLCYEAYSRYTEELRIDMEEHILIRRLENILHNI